MNWLPLVFLGHFLDSGWGPMPGREQQNSVALCAAPRSGGFRSLGLMATESFSESEAVSDKWVK